jgi:hypothetical protein
MRPRKLSLANFNGAGVGFFRSIELDKFNVQSPNQRRLDFLRQVQQQGGSQFRPDMDGMTTWSWDLQ